MRNFWNAKLTAFAAVLVLVAVAIPAALATVTPRTRRVDVSSSGKQATGGLSHGPTGGASVWPQQLCEYLLKNYPGAGRGDTLDLLAAVNRALDLLEDARLVRPISVQRTPRWQITPLGERTLAEGNVSQRLVGS